MQFRAVGGGKEGSGVRNEKVHKWDPWSFLLTKPWKRGRQHYIKSVLINLTKQQTVHTSQSHARFFFFDNIYI